MRPWILTVPKSVAITNVRLNFMYYGLLFATLCFTIIAFIQEKQFSGRVPAETRAFIKNNQGSQSKTLGLNITTSELCPHKKEIPMNISGSSHPSGLMMACQIVDDSPCYQVSSTCLPMCNRGEDGQDRISCVSSMTFAHSRSSQEVALWTARHLLRPDGGHFTVDTLLGLSAIGAEFRFRYKFQLQQAVPRLKQFFTGDSTYAGDDSTSRTVVVGRTGGPMRTFSRESPVVLTLQEVLECVPDLPMHLGNAPTAVPWEVFRDGIELSLLVACYNDDVEIEQPSLRLGATTAEPVCLLSFSYVRCCTDFQAWEAGPGSAITVDRAVVIRSRSGNSVMWFPDMSSFLASVTSALVLLGLPMKFMRWFALSFLGHLSCVYRRVLVQTFDLAEQTATMAVLLMSSSVNFLELSDVNSTQGGCPGISRSRMMERLKQALQQRRNVLDDNELSAFVDCCFKNIHPQNPWQRFQKVMPWTEAREAEVSEHAMCDIDTFNVHCSYDSAVDLDTAVKLFDGDRKRGFIERLFTPTTVEAALADVRKVRKSPDTMDGGMKDDEGDCAFPSQALTLEEKRKSLEAQQRRHEREIKILDEKMEQLERKVSEQVKDHAALLDLENTSRQVAEHLEGRLTQLEQVMTASAKQRSRQAMECLEGRLKQLEQVIEASETQERSLWTAVHQALHSMGERIHEIDVRFNDCGHAHSVLVLSQDSAGPSYNAALMSMPEVARSRGKSRKCNPELDCSTDALNKRAEDWKQQLVLMQAQVQQQQSVISELVEKRIADMEARFEAVVALGRNEQRLVKLETVVCELVRCNVMEPADDSTHDSTPRFPVNLTL